MDGNRLRVKIPTLRLGAIAETDRAMTVAEDRAMTVHAITIVEDRAMTVAEDRAMTVVEDRAMTVVEDRAMTVHAITIVEDRAMTVVEDRAMTVVEGRAMTVHVITTVEDRAMTVHVITTVEDREMTAAVEDRVMIVVEDRVMTVEEDRAMIVHVITTEKDRAMTAAVEDRVMIVVEVDPIRVVVKLALVVPFREMSVSPFPMSRRHFVVERVVADVVGEAPRHAVAVDKGRAKGEHRVDAVELAALVSAHPHHVGKIAMTVGRRPTCPTHSFTVRILTKQSQLRGRCAAGETNHPAARSKANRHTHCFH
jgi:hypothetical protein